jgi:hypothetical protein
MSEPSWQDLFLPPAQDQAFDVLPIWLVKKGANPLLALPRDVRCAAEALSLYPAQRPFARLARSLLQKGIYARLPLPLELMQLRLRRDDPLVQFLRRVGGISPTEPVRIAISVGNPNSPGRRFVMLVFNATGRPTAIVKVGLDNCARRLIEQEESVLASIRADTPGSLKVRDSLRSLRVRGFATDYVVGRTAQVRDEKLVIALLNSWIDRTQTLRVTEIADWRRLVKTCERHPVFRKTVQNLADRHIHPVLYHGDFAPWNIRIAAATGLPIALDWERAEKVGMPTWDWLHYVIQSKVLVRRAATHSIITSIERLLRSDSFIKYAERAGVRGAERAFVLGYLLYSVEVVKQTDGVPRLTGLLTELTNRWQND